MTDQPGSDVKAIRALVEGWAQAVRAKDMDGILRDHAADVLMFDVPPPLESRGIDAYRDTWALFYAASPEPPVFDIKQMNVTAGPDVAFVTATMGCVVIEKGTSAPLAFRLTIGLRKIEDRWIVMHEHHSIPATP
jgi:uncharacterized protein (TIGR02246 family)